MTFKAHADTTNTSKKINKSEIPLPLGHISYWRLQNIAQRGFKHHWAWRFAIFPAPDSLDIFSDMFGNLTLSKSFASLLEQAK